MNIAYWLNAAIFAIAIVVLWGVFVRTIRKKAAFNLYAARDRLVLLVASGMLDEDSQVFKHYYNRINTLLSDAPSVGIDDILHALFHHWKSVNDFSIALDKAETQAKRLFDDPAFEHKEVCEAVRIYYQGVGRFILAHSSGLRIAYLIAAHSTHLDKINSVLMLFMTQEQRRGLLAARYAEQEAAELAKVGCCVA